MSVVKNDISEVLGYVEKYCWYVSHINNFVSKTCSIWGERPYTCSVHVIDLRL